MLKPLTPHYVSDLQTFSPATSSLFPCGISQDTTYTWITNGPVLEVFDTCKNEQHSYWKFQSDIVAVEEFSEPYGLKLVVALSESNVLCLYDVKSSKVLKAVKLPYKICSLTVVTHEGGACLETHYLSPLLRYMFGLVAVGTVNGYVLLLDLCLDEQLFSNEFLLGNVMFITKKDEKVAIKREEAIANGHHLCTVLNENYFLRGHLIHRFGEKDFQVNSEEAAVTCVKYISPLSILAIGFQFGGVQLWNLHELSMQFSWSPEKFFSPVVKFAFQEPENDPRNYCYLWVINGQDIHYPASAELKTVATLYSIACGQKDWIEGFGTIYQDLQNCTYRFDCVLTSDVTGCDKICGSRIISCSCVHPAALLTTCKGDELATDDWLNEDFSLCILVWEAWEENLLSTCHMAIFDINQWYQAQMPSDVRGDQSSFFGFFSLEEAVDKLDEEDHIMDFCIYSSSLAKYFSLSSSEEFYYPSSLAFRAFCLTSRGTVKITYLGMQRQVLWLMEKKGLHCLTEPGELYELAVCAGLVEEASSLIKQREELLNLAVENRLIAFLSGCIVNLCGHDNTSGISLKFLFDWSWKKVTHIKMSVDKLCEPLFNCSGQDLDQQSLSLLHSYLSQLNYLARVFQLLHTSSDSVTEQGEQEINIRQEVTQLFGTFLKAVLWLHQCSLLPEHEEGDAYGENEVAFPSSMLAEAYAQRRKDIQKLHNTVSQTDLLLIDAIISELGLANQWEKVSGGGLYPPPSLYAALGCYLQYGVPMEDKHCFLLYLLLDLASFLSDKQSHVEEKLMHFPASFDLCPSRVKLTQGFWLLDHKDFQEALVTLLDPIIKPEDIQPWHHIRIIKSFLYQGEHKKALQYSQIRKPLLQTPEQVKLHLTLLLANRLTAEAFHYQRQCRDQLCMDDMLTHFFLGCHQTGNLDALLQLPFSSAEEEALVQFLFTTSEFHSQELIIGYFLQRCRPLEAAHLNTKLKPDKTEYSSERENPGIRCSLLSSYLKMLPFAQKKLDEHIRGLRKKATPQKKEVVQPVPLSSCVKSVSLRSTSLSSLVFHFEDKVKQTWEPNSSADQDKSVLDGPPRIGSQIFQRASGPREVDVLATPVAKRPLVQHSESSWTPNKKSRLLDYNPSKWSNSEKRRNAPIAEVLSIMQTPPVKRCQPIIRGSPTEAVSSILKSRSERLSVQPLLNSTDNGKELRFTLSPTRNLTARKPLRSNLSFGLPSESSVDEEITINYSKMLQHLKEDKQKQLLNLDKKQSEEIPEPSEALLSSVYNDVELTEDSSADSVSCVEQEIAMDTEVKETEVDTDFSMQPANRCLSFNASPEIKNRGVSFTEDAGNKSISAHRFLKDERSLVLDNDTEMKCKSFDRVSVVSEQTESSSSSSLQGHIHVCQVNKDDSFLMEPLTNVICPLSSHSEESNFSKCNLQKSLLPLVDEKMLSTRADISVDPSAKMSLISCYRAEEAKQAKPLNESDTEMAVGSLSTEGSHLFGNTVEPVFKEIITAEKDSSSHEENISAVLEDDFNSRVVCDIVVATESKVIQKDTPEMTQQISDRTFVASTQISECIPKESSISKAEGTMEVGSKLTDIGGLTSISCTESALTQSIQTTSSVQNSSYSTVEEGTFVLVTSDNTAFNTAQAQTLQLHVEVPVQSSPVKGMFEQRNITAKVSIQDSLSSPLCKPIDSEEKIIVKSAVPNLPAKERIQMDVEGSPSLETSAEDSFVSVNNESLHSAPSNENDSFGTPVLQKENQEHPFTEISKSEERDNVKSSRFRMKLRSGLSDMETSLSQGKRYSSRRAKASNVSPDKTVSESRLTSSMARASPKEHLFKKKTLPTTIPEFSEPEYPAEDVILPPVTPAAAVPTFFFSPPLTRSRMRRKKSQEREPSPGPSHEPAIKDASQTKAITKKKSLRKTASAHADWEETVILISPIEVIKKETSVSRRTNSQRSQRSRVVRGKGSRSRQSSKL